MALKLNRSAEPAAASPPAAEKRHTVLIVDDEPANLRLLRGILEGRHNVLEAPNGRRALELLRSLPAPPPVHLIVTDQRMPEMTGVEFLERSIDLAPDTVRVVLTGYADMAAIVDSINKGRVYAFITKPYDPEGMAVTVRRALESYELRTQNARLVGELRQLNANLEREVADRTQDLRRAHGELQARNEELRRAHRLLQARNEAVEEELRLAAEFQAMILPAFPSDPHVAHHLIYRPLGAVSGDMYYFSRGPDGSLDVFLGDGTGHGVSAAFLTMMAHAGLDGAPHGLGPGGALGWLNHLLAARDLHGQAITGVYLRASPDGTLRHSSAGHPPVVVVPADGSPVETLPLGGCGLGFFVSDGAPYPEGGRLMKPGDRAVAYTDGLYERTPGGGGRFGVAEVAAFCGEHRGLGLAELLEALAARAEEVTGSPPTDDLTLLGLEYLG